MNISPESRTLMDRLFAAVTTDADNLHAITQLSDDLEEDARDLLAEVLVNRFALAEWVERLSHHYTQNPFAGPDLLESLWRSVIDEGPDGPDTASDLVRLLTNPKQLTGLADEIEETLPDAWEERLLDAAARIVAAADIGMHPQPAQETTDNRRQVTTATTAALSRKPKADDS